MFWIDNWNEDKFYSDPVVNSTKSKRTRIQYICKSLKLNRLLERCYSTVYATADEHVKSEKQAKVQFESAKRRYRPEDDESGTIRNVIASLFEAILLAPFAGTIFVDSYALRAKCHLVMQNFEDALYDSTVAIKYGGLSFEQIRVKSIALFALHRHRELKDFLFNDSVAAVVVDNKVEIEIKRMGYEHLTMDYMRHCIPEKRISDSENPHLNLVNRLLNFERNYILDKRAEVVIDPYKGRYMMAKKFIPSGTKILLERSFSVSFASCKRREYCLYCNAQTNERCIPCKYCIDVVFCNETCFERAWTLFHQHECLLISLFDDTLFTTEHMYRTLNKVGVSRAIEVFDKFAKLKADPQIKSQAKKKEKSVERIINDSIIESYMDSDTLRTVPLHLLSENNRIEMYEMHCTLLDHNETYQLYYDINYMPLAVSVSMMLLLNEYLRKRIKSPALKFCALDLEDMDRLVEENKRKRRFEDFKVFGHSMDTFLKLVEIVQVNIRKLGVNVFSWNSQDAELSNVGTCQVLIGSFINHSCDPNVEWDFTAGCISYTAVRDIQAGEEINNSYGSHCSFSFHNRQSSLINSYYFSCYCTACMVDVVDYSRVLRCQSCSGPVVVLPQMAVDATCMLCHKVYPHADFRMKRVNEHRAKFTQLWRYFEQPSVHAMRDPMRNSKFANFLSQLTDSMDYEVTYVYTYNRKFQYNLMLFCSLLARIGKIGKACFYGHYSINKELFKLHKPKHETYKGIDSVAKLFGDIHNNLFYLKLYESYLKNYELLPEDDKDYYDEYNEPTLYEIAEERVEYYRKVVDDQWKSRQYVIKNLQGKSSFLRDILNILCLEKSR